MCGLTGWVDLEAVLKTQVKRIEKMTETLNRRGPDDSGYHISEHALLGHRRLVVVDPEGGRQPMTRHKGERTYTLVYNGELYNTEEIRTSLLEKGYTFEGYSDTEVLLTAFMEWGDQCVERFNGIFAFAIWDETERRLFLARDPLGVKPLFYAQKGSSLLFASEIKAILAAPEMEAVLDNNGIMELLGLGPARTPGCGVFKGINEVPPGCRMVFDSRGLKLSEYWRLESYLHTDSFEETVAKVRFLLTDAIERQLVSDVPVCAFLSGGLDSSAIAAVTAARFGKEGRGKLNTFSIDYQDNDIFFKPDEYQPDSDEYWARRMSEYMGSCHTNIIISTRSLVEALRDAVKANDLPGMADIDSSLFLFCREVRKNSIVAISGECADEIFGGYPWFRREEDILSNTFPWSRSLNERKSLLAAPFDKLPLNEYVETRYKESLAGVPLLEGESEKDAGMRALFYLNIKWFMATLLNRKDRMSMANSLEVRVPFADYRLVNYAFNIPWHMKYCDNREKGIMRRALKGILPDDVLNRRKSPYPKTHNPAYLKILQSWMREILADEMSPLTTLIDRRKLNALVESGGLSMGRPWYGQLMGGPQMLAYLIQMDIWLRMYHVRIQ